MSDVLIKGILETSEKAKQGVQKCFIIETRY